MRRFILLAGLALAAVPAIPQTADAHGGWERERAWRHHEFRREQAWRRHERREWRREQAWRRDRYERRAYRQGYGYGPPVAYAQPGLTIAIPFR
ncbi:hypothetical protein [Roseomonas indoligenes]|uniref:Uncharacterized protein n=1 Tax=Roseomonas indoligenes TaxID=2820811 RepID=A0A940MTI3_9PROT|nr:hypothetical protein [Pararoseomonas indoligenes]MBP0493144.1 hypothetical protein [Pararoseomonas indoligenes]